MCLHIWSENQSSSNHTYRIQYEFVSGKRGPHTRGLLHFSYSPSKPGWRQSAAFQNFRWAKRLVILWYIQLALIAGYVKTNISLHTTRLNWSIWGMGRKGHWNRCSPLSQKDKDLHVCVPGEGGKLSYPALLSPCWRIQQCWQHTYCCQSCLLLLCQERAWGWCPQHDKTVPCKSATIQLAFYLFISFSFISFNILEMAEQPSAFWKCS